MRLDVTSTAAHMAGARTARFAHAVLAIAAQAAKF